MKRIIIMASFLLCTTAFAAGGVEEVMPYLGVKHFPYAPSISCQANKALPNADLAEAEQFWVAQCPLTKAGAKRLAKPAQVVLQGLLDKVLVLPEEITRSADAQFLIGRLWLLNQSKAEAITYLIHAVELDSRAMFATALAAAFERHFPQLVEGQRQELDLQVANLLGARLTTLASPSADDFLMTARLYYMGDVIAGADAILQSAHERLPQSASVALAQAMVTLCLNNASDASAMLSKLTTVPPALESLRQYLMGIAEWRTGKLDMALQSLANAIKLAPRNTDAKRLQKQILAV